MIQRHYPKYSIRPIKLLICGLGINSLTILWIWVSTVWPACMVSVVLGATTALTYIIGYLYSTDFAQNQDECRLDIEYSIISY